MELDDQPYEVTFEAVADGVLHVGELDSASQQWAYYETEVSKGEQWTLDVDPASPAAELARSTGDAVRPVVSQVDAAWLAEHLEASPPVRESGSRWRWIVAALVAAGSGILIQLWLRLPSLRWKHPYGE